MDVIKCITIKHRSSGGHCGTTLADICNSTGKPMKEVKKELNILWKEGKVAVRDGAKGKLVFLKESVSL